MYSIVVLVVLAFLHEAAGSDAPNLRVVNGQVVNPPHSFPWQLSLQRASGSSFSHTCGAVVYQGGRFAITAAHCVDGASPSSLRVQCGAHNLALSETGKQSMGVSAITMHPGYNPNGSGFPNDIAVLRLTGTLRLDATCAAAKLDTGANFDGQASVITGWGRLSGGGALPSQLQRGDVDVLSHNTCRNYWGNTVNSNYHICVKDLGDRIFGACNGDSGGPAQVGDTVIGLASFVASGCLTQYPSAYVRVSTYISWIQSTVASMG